eukprot:1012400-Alexandrium_andersonii.AAC.1
MSASLVGSEMCIRDRLISSMVRENWLSAEVADDCGVKDPRPPPCQGAPPWKRPPPPPPRPPPPLLLL